MFELQGHRGARGLKPENTLPSFEAALDLGVGSIETDIHLTRDRQLILIHDARISERIFSLPVPGTAPDPRESPLVSSLTLDQLRAYRADGNPDPGRFPRQDRSVTPLAEIFSGERGLAAYGIPTLTDLFAFVVAYAGDLGGQAGKTAEQRAAASRVLLDLELKRVPFHPETIGDGFDGHAASLLEKALVEQVLAAEFASRVRVRSFDHRAVQAVSELCPDLETALLISGTAPLHPGRLVKEAGARVYCPDFEFLDEQQVRLAHAEGIKVIPWTVNQREDWQKLLAWGVDGITTDYPDGVYAPRP